MKIRARRRNKRKKSDVVCAKRNFRNRGRKSFRCRCPWAFPDLTIDASSWKHLILNCCSGCWRREKLRRPETMTWSRDSRIHSETDRLDWKRFLYFELISDTADRSRLDQKNSSWRKWVSVDSWIVKNNSGTFWQRRGEIFLESWWCWRIRNDWRRLNKWRRRINFKKDVSNQGQIIWRSKKKEGRRNDRFVVVLDVKNKWNIRIILDRDCCLRNLKPRTKYSRRVNERWWRRKWINNLIERRI